MLNYAVSDFAARWVEHFSHFEDAVDCWLNKEGAFYLDTNHPGINELTQRLTTSEEVANFRIKLKEHQKRNDQIDLFWDTEFDRHIQRTTKIEKDHINPDHYKEVIPGYQYIQLMPYLLKGFDGVEAHLLGQIYKYSFRLGKKDPKPQDAGKISWYAQALADYYRTGKISADYK